MLLARNYWSSQPATRRAAPRGNADGGVGGMKLERRVTLPEVDFGGIRFADVPATLNEDASRCPTSGGNVGIELFKPFDVDVRLAPAARIYLRRTGAVTLVEKERAGLRTELAGDRLNVVYVSPRGPAARAGLKPGDQIVAVDGARSTPASIDRPDWTRRAAGQAISPGQGRRAVAKVTLADYYLSRALPGRALVNGRRGEARAAQ